MHKFKLTTTVVAIVFISGCSTLTMSDEQEIDVTTNCSNKKLSYYCSASNDRGVVAFQTPAKIVVKQSYFDLQIKCQDGLFRTPSYRIPSSVGIPLIGNILFGGVVGSAIDLQNSETYQYPTSINIEPQMCNYIK